MKKNKYQECNLSQTVLKDSSWLNVPYAETLNPAAAKDSLSAKKRKILKSLKTKNEIKITRCLASQTESSFLGSISLDDENIYTITAYRITRYSCLDRFDC